MSTAAITVLVIVAGGALIKFIALVCLGYNYGASRRLDEMHVSSTSTEYRRIQKQLFLSAIGVIIGALLSNGVLVYIAKTAACQDVYHEIAQLFVDLFHKFVN